MAEYTAEYSVFMNTSWIWLSPPHVGHGRRPARCKPRTTEPAGLEPQVIERVADAERELSVYRERDGIFTRAP